MAEKLSTEAKERIKREMKDSPGRINCTSDLWSDDSQRLFMCITTHFYNKDRHLVNRLIALRVVEGTHAGAHLAEIFFEALDKFGIVPKLGLITLDNASNNNTFMAQLEEYMATRGMDFDRHRNCLRCFPHVINLAVQDILAALADSATNFQRREESKGSTLTDEVVAYLIAFVPSLAEHTITHRDFEVLYDIKTVLSLAHRVQELLSSDKTPTLSYALPLYHALIDQWRQLQRSLPALSYAIGARIKKIEDYIAWVRLSPAYIVAMALNPSIGYRWIDENLPAESGRARDIMKSHMLHCLEDQQRIQHESSISGLSSSRPVNKGETAATRLNQGYATVLTAGVDIRPSSSIFSSYTLPTLSDPARPPPNSSGHTLTGPPIAHPSAQLSRLNEATVKLEHQKFKRVSVPTPKELEGLGPLDYWMAKSAELPLIFKIALNTLPAQASSVSSERVFLSSKFTCSQYRNRILASKVEALQILKHAL